MSTARLSLRVRQFQKSSPFARSVYPLRYTIYNNACLLKNIRKYSAEAKPKKEDKIVEEKVTGQSSKHEFKAETKKLLNIVANSLYSEKEVFVRELASNAADALEKLRYNSLTSPNEFECADELSIKINVDKEQNILTIEDNGIGMTEEDLNNNLGTIARSGSKAFMENISKNEKGSSTKDKIIGQFGVGFYSAFMVGDKITVFTRSAQKGSKGLCWSSDGLGTYEIAEADGVQIGTKIIIHLNNSSKEYANEARIKDILKKYSNFVGFPIFLNNVKVNTIEALWAKDKSQINEEDYSSFYRFVANSYDSPQYTLHYKTDAPVQIQSLLFAPQYHEEHLGMGRIEPGVSLYSRKVLIQPKSKKILPEWLRFVKGVIDSEDIPLNLSRELLQNGAIIEKVKKVVTSRIIKWFEEESKRDAEKYEKFYEKFGLFFKEGICGDNPEYKDDIAKLLRFQSSASEKSLISLKQYISRVKADQKSIFYLLTPSREFSQDSPYFEPFKRKGVEVLYLHELVDEFVMNRLGEFSGYKLINVETQEAIQALDAIKSDLETESVHSLEHIDESDGLDLSRWMENLMPAKVKKVTISKGRLGKSSSSPAIIVNHQTGSTRHLMELLSKRGPNSLAPEPEEMELNPYHPIIHGLVKLRLDDAELATMIAEQMFDNAKIAAGIMNDPRSMLFRLNNLLERSLNIAEKKES